MHGQVLKVGLVLSKTRAFLTTHRDASVSAHFVGNGAGERVMIHFDLCVIAHTMT